ncbi:STAS domain-containing protein [Streptomyces sp. NPDC019224]|uniref:STAS domain-containing protein n=1 Tax=Streptomyces sp. NPDC019224 TaxID=3154484 RepID=UPI0033EAC27C
MNPKRPAAVVVLPGHLTRADVPRLCAELEALLSAAPEAHEVHCDASAVGHPDLITVEAVARLSLTARRAGGRRLRLRDAQPGLRALLDLVGLGEATGAAEPSP